MKKILFKFGFEICIRGVDFHMGDEITDFSKCWSLPQADDTHGIEKGCLGTCGLYTEQTSTVKTHIACARKMCFEYIEIIFIL